MEEGFVACTGQGEDGVVWEGRAEGMAEVVGEGGRGYDEGSCGMGTGEAMVRWCG